MEKREFREPADVRTVGETLEGLLPGALKRDSMPSWPPDVFAIAAYLLRESAAYLRVIEEWPPTTDSPPEGSGDDKEAWVKKMQKLGRQWHESTDTPPAPLLDWWQSLLVHRATPLDKIAAIQPLLHSLVQLCAVADEASVGTGIRYRNKELTRLREETRLSAREGVGSSFCKEVDPSRARVLPKCHTPQTGLTVRSLSHHLSLWTSQEVIPHWRRYPYRFWRDQEIQESEEQPHSINLLLAPWPRQVRPVAFRPAQPSRGRLDNMPGNFGFFRYQGDPAAAQLEHKVRALFRAASRLTDQVDGIVLPEMALHQQEYEAIRGLAAAEGSFLIAGVYQPRVDEDNDSGPGRNYLALEVPLSGTHYIEERQDKHHRWRLDRSQIVQYGLGGQLDPERSWWEYSKTRSRELTFVSLLPWLSLCALLCEDLARQDPVSRLVRSVGPNLVIALLMDGPQLTSRWPARYATVLAEDPGSSVLTLTSLGMCSQSRPPGYSVRRTVALWKDASSGKAIEIDVEPDADGILLNLVRTKDEEWTADGRSDHGAAGYPILAGIHQVKISAEDLKQVREGSKDEDTTAGSPRNQGEL